MRTSRKGRRRLEEAARFEEEGRRRWGAVAFRMTRKRRKKLAAAQAGEEPRLKRFVLQNLRMTRTRKRKMREEAAIRQTAQAASISALALLPPAAGSAASLNAMNDLSAAFESLVNDRNRIRDFHAAKRNAAEAAAALQQAEAALQMARQDKRNAERGLEEARQNLEQARRNLKRVARELEKAQMESAKRTQEAIAAQQAVADFAPQVWQQESVVQDLQGQKQGKQAAYEALGRELGYLQEERDDLEERIRKAWESVDYAQNRLNDVIAMVNRAQSIQPEQHAKEEQWQAYDNELQQLDAAVDNAEAWLDSLNSQLDALQEAREAAEDAERDARELVRDLTNEHADAEKDVAENETAVSEAETWNQEAAKGIAEAEQYVSETQKWKAQADYELEHFGEGTGIGSGFEYDNWQGAGLPHGHQLYQPIEFYAAEKHWDFSLSTGWLSSDTGLVDGHVSGWTDTTLGIAYKNDHKVNDVHYTLNVNVPTGKDNVHQNAMMADNLARFNSFSEGWQFTPGIEVTHRFTERDSLTGRLNYTFRGDYKYRRSLTEVERISVTTPTGAVDIQAQEEINPGNKFQQEIEYRHIGEQQQLSARMIHVNASYAVDKGTMKSYMDNAGHIHLIDMPYGSGRNYDGEDWTLQLFNSQDIDVKNSWQYYVMGSYQSASTGGIHRYYGGLGYTHCFDKQQKAYFLLNHGEERGQRYDWRLGKWNSSRYLNSVIIGYDYRLDDRSELKAKLERYRIHGSSADSYHGWKMSLMWNRSF
ncbi:hypothetical protein SAMN05216582_10453 [Selenomonas ruminantium]|uniref:Uncharacterized protein n=1 Tax=Selenomonas ruminantium TaxID=971 RepID=A0A1M6SGF4_SELRU|nr:transporter [Selenomonas ruminantium]SHK43568.1 hypothetical protein SAMN05216582_10453 [Selenomonas ruminantium]